ncbi:MAG: HAD family phosphatase [Bacteroidales bacterium]|nr:HAD family phosphatase [Bacteroidales bacterium]
MIKNVCFDVGNVLIDYQPDRYLREIGIPDYKREAMLKDIFFSEEWQQLDNGDITFDEAYDIIESKSILTREEIISVFEDHLLKIFSLIDANVSLLPVIKQYGYKLFYISNFTERYFYRMQKKFPIWDIFDDGVISAAIKMSKPGKDIFLYAFNQFGIDPKESVFIDDLPENVATAKSLGMETINLPYGHSLKERLEELKII